VPNTMNSTQSYTRRAVWTSTKMAANNLIDECDEAYATANATNHIDYNERLTRAIAVETHALRDCGEFGKSAWGKTVPSPGGWDPIDSPSFNAAMMTKAPRRHLSRRSSVPNEYRRGEADWRGDSRPVIVWGSALTPEGAWKRGPARPLHPAAEVGVHRTPRRRASVELGDVQRSDPARARHPVLERGWATMHEDQRPSRAEVGHAQSRAGSSQSQKPRGRVLCNDRSQSVRMSPSERNAEVSKTQAVKAQAAVREENMAQSRVGSGHWQKAQGHFLGDNRKQSMRISTSERKAAMLRTEAARVEAEAAREEKISQSWERVFCGELRQLQYQASLTMATKLPDIGRWEKIGANFMGTDFTKLKLSMQTPASPSEKPNFKC